MATFYIDTGGNASNSGTSDNNSPDFSGSAASVAGSVVTLDGSPDLSGVSTSGPTQAAIHITDATNSNQKIFKITTVDNVLKTVTVSVAPTGVTSSAWRIGGRHVLTRASIEGTTGPGDTVIFNNSPAAAAAVIWTFRTAGDSVTGPVTIKGKTGVRPVFNTTDTNNCVASAVAYSRIENIEIDQDGATGHGINTTGSNCVCLNIKVSDAGGNGVTTTGAGSVVIGCEISGCGADGINYNGSQGTFIGNYIHDVTGDGIELSGTTPRGQILNNIIDTCAARGIYLSGSVSTGGLPSVIYGNTVYGCGNSGLEITDADNYVVLLNNIFQDNGNAAGEYNVEWVAGSHEASGSLHYNNIFYHQGGGGGANLLGLTVNSTEAITDPLFTDPSNGDFTLQTLSPARATGYPGIFVGGSTSYLDIGAVQRLEPATFLRNPGMNGGLV